MNSGAGDLLSRRAREDLDNRRAQLTAAVPDYADRLSRQWHSERDEFVSRLRADYHELAQVFNDGDSLGVVVALETGLSDRHRGGRTVYRVAFAAGVELIYKPRDVRADITFHALLDALRPAVDLPRSPGSLVRETHGWFENVKPAEVSRGESARRYWRRFGSLVCLLDVLDARDCHRENLVASDDHPVLVDAEVLFHRPISGVHLRPADDPLTVLATGLTPYWKRNGSLHVEASGGGCPPVQHIDDVIAGFDAMYCALLDARTGLVAATGPIAAFGTVEMRCLYRDTSTYLQVLRDAVACGELTRGWLLPELNGENPDSRMQPVIEAEVDALLRLDVPRFTALAGGKALNLDGTRVLDDWFPETGLQQAGRRLDMLNPGDRARRADTLRSIYAIAVLETGLR